MAHNDPNNISNEKPGFRLLNSRPGFGTTGVLEVNPLYIPRSFIAPLEILFEISTICNMSCRHCYNQSSSKGTVFNESLFERLVDEIIHLQPLRCCFSGGEPFIFSGKILPAAYKMRRSGILTSAVTNGWFITNSILPMISESFVGIQVIIDGATKEIHDKVRGRKGAFERAVNALDLLTGKVQYLQVAHAATSLSYLQTPEVALFLTEKGIERLVIQPIAMQGRSRQNPDLGLTDDMLHKLVELVAKARITHANTLQIDLVAPLQAIRRNIFFKKSPNQQMYISSTGEVGGNPFIPVYVGNCREKSLREIWRDGVENYYSRKEVFDYLLNEGNIS